MCDEDDIFYFKFTSVTGLEQVLEKGPWMIHNQPLMLTKWTPNLSVSMDNVAMVPVWVKIHKVPMVAYSEDGLSLITTQIGKPILLDSFTSSMCKDPWGQIGYARALIEISNETDLKKEVIMAILIIDEDYISIATVGETSDGNGGFDVFGEPNLESVLNKVDLDSRIEGMFIVEESRGSKPKGASTPFNDVPDVCSKVFKYWEWTSNAHVCTKGCRIILGWHMDVVNVVVLSQTDQMRLLWAELGLYKLVVRGMPWTLLGDFNVALNLEDTCFGSSSLSTDMVEFKDCVADIEVIDINCSGLHYMWNQKPKSGGGILKKLGHIIGNVEFLDTFPGAHAYFQPYRISDHSPSVTSKLKALKKPLRKLVHDHGNLHDRVNKLRLELDEVQKALDLCPTDQNLCDEEAIYVQAFNESKLDEERFLKHISDNILITQELMHGYHRDRGLLRCAFKIDIQKSYDMVDWRFLGEILTRFG
ncbi:hypothetical protein Tco_1180378, partial [Tanacetum coccineum]